MVTRIGRLCKPARGARNTLRILLRNVSTPAPQPARASNLIVARLFEEIAQSLEVAGEQTHRLRAYRREVTSTATALEHLLDTLAQDRPQPSALDLLFAR